MRYRFPPFELDDETLTLKKHGESVPIRPQALEVLLYLVRCRDRFVTREELVRNVWSGATVSDTAVPQAILAARRAIGDGEDDATAVQTIRGRGYRFVAKVSTDRSSAFPGGSGQPGQFVGRDACVRRFEAALAAAANGHGDVVLLVGAPGYGKSRAAKELSARARAMAGSVVEVTCHPGGPELGVWLDVLRALGVKDPRAILGATTTESSAEGGGVAVVDQLGAALSGSSANGSLVVVIDDLHLADDGSLVLLRLLTDALRASRVVILATYSDAALAANSVLARTIAGLIRQDPSRRVPLRPLAAEEVTALAASLFGPDFPRQAVERVFAKSDGSPLLATQLLFLLCSEEWLGAPGDVATSALLSTHTVREAIGLHLDELSRGCRRALAVASIFGRCFSITELVQTLETDRTSALGVLDEALRARIIQKEPSSPGGFRFVHALVRDILYKELTLSERARLHESAGRSFAASGDAPAAAEQLARAADALGLTPEEPAPPGARVEALLSRLDAAHAR